MRVSIVFAQNEDGLIRLRRAHNLWCVPNDSEAVRFFFGWCFFGADDITLPTIQIAEIAEVD
jgi:hypothetical protein